ncbi:MAG: hypothetical protein IKS51_01790 [Erysipelotrichaceae bacterium]|nr:hypothetical protein [Erysipelotrichaceae bacterium]
MKRKRNIRILFLALIIFSVLLSITGCSSDPNNINGKYVVNGFQTWKRGETTYKWDSLVNDEFYVVIEKAKIVDVHLNGSSYTGNFKGKGNQYNTIITWGSGNGPADQIFSGFKCLNTNIYAKDGEVQLTFYLTYSSSSDWTTGATVRFQKVD